MDETVGFPESGMSLPIKVGSVDIPAVLQDTASQLSQKGRVGLYCGGVHLCFVNGNCKQCVRKQLLNKQSSKNTGQAKKTMLQKRKSCLCHFAAHDGSLRTYPEAAQLHAKPHISKKESTEACACPLACLLVQVVCCSSRVSKALHLTCKVAQLQGG